MPDFGKFEVYSLGWGTSKHTYTRFIFLFCHWHNIMVLQSLGWYDWKVDLPILYSWESQEVSYVLPSYLLQITHLQITALTTCLPLNIQYLSRRLIKVSLTPEYIFTWVSSISSLTKLCFGGRKTGFLLSYGKDELLMCLLQWMTSSSSR